MKLHRRHSQDIISILLAVNNDNSKKKMEKEKEKESVS